MENLTRDFGTSYVSLAVAAAMTFHQVHGNTKAIVTHADYDDALNIAASALSRLIPIYALLDPRQGRIAIPVDLGTQHFARGATELRDSHGTLAELSVKRGELESALSLMKRTGLPLSFLLLPDAEEQPVRVQKAAAPDSLKD